MPEANTAQGHGKSDCAYGDALPPHGMGTTGQGDYSEGEGTDSLAQNARLSAAVTAPVCSEDWDFATDMGAGMGGSGRGRISMVASN